MPFFGDPPILWDAPRPGAPTHTLGIPPPQNFGGRLIPIRPLIYYRSLINCYFSFHHFSDSPIFFPPQNQIILLPPISPPPPCFWGPPNFLSSPPQVPARPGRFIGTLGKHRGPPTVTPSEGGTQYGDILGGSWKMLGGLFVNWGEGVQCVGVLGCPGGGKWGVQTFGGGVIIGGSQIGGVRWGAVFGVSEGRFRVGGGVTGGVRGPQIVGPPTVPPYPPRWGNFGVPGGGGSPEIRGPPLTPLCPPPGPTCAPRVGSSSGRGGDAPAGATRTDPPTINGTPRVTECHRLSLGPP